VLARSAVSAGRSSGSNRASTRPVLQRAEHERERGAELVTHVREERRFRPIQLGQRLGTPPLLLVGERVGGRGADLSGDQREEAAVSGIQQAVGIEAGDEHRGPPVLARARDREQHDALRRLVPRAPGKLGRETVAGDLHELAGLRRLGERPGGNFGERRPRLDLRGAGQLERLPVGSGEMDEGKRQVARIGGERLGAPDAGLGDGARVGGAGRELAQKAELTLADDALRVIGVGAEDPAGPALVVGDGV
jgi:hypothetical protein